MILSKRVFYVNLDFDLKDIYPVLLGRLDDSQDKIRIEVTKSIVAFFNCEDLVISTGTFEYVMRHLFIHLDD